MSDIGKSATGAIVFLSKFFNDVSQLAISVDEAMTSGDLASAYGSACFWGSSAAYYQAAGWIPRYLARVYVPERRPDSKPDTESLVFAFFCVYFMPKLSGEPLAVWGTGSQREKADLWPSVEELLVRRDGPEFLRAVPTADWVTVDDPPALLTEVNYRAAHVVTFDSARTVEELVTTPLLERMARLCG